MAKISPKTLGNLAYIFTHCLAKTVRTKISLHDAVDIHQPGVYAFWHGTHFAPVMYVGKELNTKAAGLVSASKDGEILATWLHKMGYHTIRGSSSRKAVAGVVQLIQAVRQGYSVGIALDGPRGPRYDAKPGACFVGAKTGVPIYPIGAVYNRKFQFKKSWDKFELPLPIIGKIAMHIGEPFFLAKDADMDEANQQLKQAIFACEQKAAELL